MTDKEKAKAYDEAIERAKSVLLDCTPEERKVVEYITPELKESEIEKIRGAIIRLFELESRCHLLPTSSRITYGKAIEWLKKQGEQNPSWSEEDKKMHDFAIRAIGLCKQYAINHQVNGYSNLPDIPKKYEELQDWLKSLKERYTWKPSEEQIKALRVAIGDEQGSDCCCELRSLLKDLKSL